MMQRFIIRLVGLLAIAAFFVLGYTRMSRSEKPDDLLLKNIEALATDEDESSGMCVGKGSIVCPFSKKEVEHVYIFYSSPH